MASDVDEEPLRDDRGLDELDDEQDREELRSRYYGLLQELRVVLPGVQVLLAFLLTVPFTQRYEDLDGLGRILYAVSLVGAALSAVCLLTPTVLHRVGERRARRERLRWGIRMTVAGTAALAVAITSAVWCVTRLVYSSIAAELITGSIALAIVVLWLVLPRSLDRDPASPPGPRRA